MKPVITAKEVTARVPAKLLSALKRDAGEFFVSHVNAALATWPEDPGLAAVRLVQLCGRCPDPELVAQLRTVPVVIQDT
jgi:hypothetical protein